MARSALSFLFTCLTAVLFIASAQTAKRCSSDSDCTVAGCSCRAEYCVDLPLLRSNLRQCPNCATNSSCTASVEDKCLSTISKCDDCGFQAARPAIMKCAPDSAEVWPPTPSTPEPQSITDASLSFARCSSDMHCTIAGCSCTAGFCVDLPLLRSNVDQCPRCASNSECTANAEDECRSDINKCSHCVERKGTPAFTKCKPDSSASSPLSTDSPDPEPSTGDSWVTKKCTSDSECTKDGCVCSKGDCLHPELLRENVRLCSDCVSNEDCPSTGDECLAEIRKCKDCTTKAALPAFRKCTGGITSPSTVTASSKPGTSTQSPKQSDTVPPIGTQPDISQPSAAPKSPAQSSIIEPGSNGTNTSKVSSDGSCSLDTNCMKGCSCFRELTPPFCVSMSVMAKKCHSLCGKNNQSKECAECRKKVSGAASKSCVPKCISTEFLLERGLGHAALRHFDAADVLCIPGLPCGTAGHLLRECASNVACKLVSYRHVCQHRSDCVASSMKVSQLKHSVDWSQYHISSGSSTLSLTSLSANPDASPMAPSRLIAKATDLLNHVGLGFVCDAISTLPGSLAEVSNIIRFPQSL